MQLLRSLLFVPGNRANMLDKAVGLRPDAVVPDMEDSVPAAEKANAREMIASFLPTLAETGHQIIPRVNSLHTSVGWRSAAHISFGAPRCGLWVETAGAIVNAFSICRASKRVIAIAFGGEDLTNDMAIPRTESEEEIAYPRSVVAVTARAAGVLALETPYFNYRDDEDRRGGINTSYMSSDEEIEQARRVVDAFAEAEVRGSAATSLDGMVIDVPVVERARKVLSALPQSAYDE
ncbi:Citrate lyase subunit beta [Geodia barretti]|uniref:Citrate lyase subunit beta n=1 Tax=Geodia barretti TaxID=519541 RepID=A0AA35R4V9_GEOBA|nr:Citrate lyase subunit beta [Geodia barretti]